MNHTMNYESWEDVHMLLSEARTVMLFKIKAADRISEVENSVNKAIDAIEKATSDARLAEYHREARR